MAIRSNQRGVPGWVLAVALVPLLTGSAAAGHEVLAEGVPQDAFVYAAWMHNPERDYMQVYHEEVRSALRDSGLIEGVQSMFHDMVPEEAQDQIEGSMEMVHGLLGAVDWEALVEKNGAWAMLLGDDGPISMTLFEVDPKKLPEIVAGCGKILDTAAGMIPGATRLSEGPEGGPVVHGVAMQGTSYGMFIGTHGPVFVFANERSALDRSLALLAAEGKNGSMASNPRFHQALGRLPAPEDSLSFVDMAHMIEVLRASFRADLPPDPQGELAQIASMVETIFREVDVAEYIASVEYTEGFTNRVETITRFRQDADQKLAYRLFAGQPTFDAFHRYVPKDATSFTLSGGVDIAGLYRFAVDFVKNKVPDGEQLLARWERMQEEVLGIDVYNDLLSNIRGDSITVRLPSKTPNPFGGPSSASVTLLGIRNGEKLAKLLQSGLEQASKMAAERGAPVSFKKVEGMKDGTFHSVVVAMAQFVQPVFGIRGDHFYVATDVDSIRRVLSVADNPANSIIKNPRFTSLGILPYTDVSRISFRNLEGHYGSIAQALQGMGMGMAMASGMLSAQIPDPEARERFMSMMSHVGELMPRLAPILEKLDYKNATASFTYFDEKTRTAVTRKATAIQLPKKAETTPKQ